MKFSVFQQSRRGGRAVNEDRMGYCYTRGSGLFMLADGMGGHPEGEVAAQLALQVISSLYEAEARPRIAGPVAFLSRAVMAAQERLLRYASERGMLDTPRTTLVTLLLQDGQATWIHCGDSRLYVVRKGKLLLRTRDHSFVEHQAAGGPEGVNRNVLFSCLGSPTEPVFDLSQPFVLHQGDRLLLCSDGLWGNLSDDTITEALAMDRPVAEAVPDMVAQALLAGGKRCDNVTALALEWETPHAIDTAPEADAGDSDGGFASTIAASPHELQLDEFDDAAIERSIAEINEAIRRSSAGRG